MASPSLLRIERLNYVLGGAMVIGAALTQTRAVALGVAVGVALTCANFFVLRKLVTKWTRDAAAGKTGAAPFLMLPKMVAMMGAVAAAVIFLPIDPIAFIVGYSLFFISIVIDLTYSGLRASPKTPSNEPDRSDEHHG